MKKNLRRRLLLAAMCVAMLTVAASATEGSGTSATAATVQAAFQTGFQGMVSDALSMIAMIVPIALGLAGVIFVVRKAISWFKSVAK